MKIKTTVLILIVLLTGGSLWSQSNNQFSKSSKFTPTNSSTGTITATIGLTTIIDDKVPVTIHPEKLTQEVVIYRLPKVIPGTYEISDFGNFVDDFKALNYKGEEIKFKRIDENSWEIPNATELDKITYLVNDTFDIENRQGITTPFSPSGTNIDTENFVLNLPGFIGYFEDLENYQYILKVTAPSALNNSSALRLVGEELGKDPTNVTHNYYASRYFDITDNPMMYGDFEVEAFQVGDIKVVLSVYSPNKIHTALDLKKTVYEMMEAQKNYLGDINSTARYDIFLYLSEMDETSPTGFGALEHHTSTVVVLPESMSLESLASSMIDVVSHEFFHIVTPLSIHSEDVHYFDYYEPTFSKHLWMYEGVTEYFATLFQVNQGLVNEDEFYASIIDKIQTAKGLDDTMSFTVMSENILTSPYAENYYNVYQKGALIGMCLDILLREESDGQRGILSLMKELSLKYGKEQPFEDDQLIDQIVAMTYPSVGVFFNRHIIGETPIDYSLFFEKVGLEIINSKVETNYIQNNGELIVALSEQGNIYFTKLVENNSFWHEQGAKSKDIISEINGTIVSVENAQQVFTEVYMWTPGSEVEIKLLRGEEEVIIKTQLTQSYTMGNGLQKIENETEVQAELRNAWLKG